MSALAHLKATGALSLALLTASCTKPVPEYDADVIVVGAGIAGLAAAIELGRGGARVLVVDANSVGGGHAVVAGGFALVGTPLQESKGIGDSPDLAFRDLMAWGETNDPEWTRDYVEHSRSEVYDFLTALGVEFKVIIPTPEFSVPRFHFTQGTAVNAVVPMLRAALQLPNVGFAFNAKAVDLVVGSIGVTGVAVENTRTGEQRTLSAPAVILATGGFENNLDKVWAHWPQGVPKPERLLVGASAFADGDGFDFAAKAGAELDHLDRQVIFTGGIADPRDPAGKRALLASDNVAIWVNTQGERFVNERAPDKITGPAVLALEPANYWMIFDAEGRKRFSVRDARWLTSETIEAEIIRNSDITQIADSIDALAQETGLPADALRRTIDRVNGFAAAGADLDFGRPLNPIAVPPFYAVRAFPFTRKNMGGVVIDKAGHALDAAGDAVPGLYAAGELTGVVGINGNVGMSGTFLGPSLYTGRLAGRGALADLVRRADWHAFAATDTLPRVVWLRAEPGAPPLGEERSGYWHFLKAHGLVAERKLECSQCHDQAFAMAPPESVTARVAQARVCTTCH